MSGPATHPTVAILQVSQILDGARLRGLDTAAILRRAGIAPGLLDAPLSRVTQSQYAALILLLRRLLRDELWGLCSRPLKPGSFEQGCRLLMGCRTLGEALRTGLAYYHLLIDDFAPRLVVDGAQAEVRLVSRVPREPRQGFAERTFCFFSFGLASWLVARRIPVQALLYRPSDEGHSSDGARLFQAAVRYDSPWVGYRFDARWLDLPVVQTPHTLQEFLRQAPAGLLVRYRDQTSLSERIRRLLRRQLAGDMPSLEAVSAALALTPQTLRRRLSEEGQGFQTLKDELRRDAAIEFLGQPELTLADIAARLGFSEASTFHRAFKTWTGLTPSEYRLTRRSSRDGV